MIKAGKKYEIVTFLGPILADWLIGVGLGVFTDDPTENVIIRSGDVVEILENLPTEWDDDCPIDYVRLRTSEGKVGTACASEEWVDGLTESRTGVGGLYYKEMVT